VRHASHPTEAFVIRKVKQLVLKDGPSNGCTILVLAQASMRQGEVICRIEDVIAEKLVYRAVHRVRPGLGDDIDLRTRRASHLRGVEIGGNAKLRNRVDRGTHTDRADNAFVIVQPVDELVVRAFRLPVHRNGGSQASIVRPLTAAQRIRWPFIGAGNELCQLHKVATIQRKVFYLPIRDHSAEYGAVCLYVRCCTAHFNRLGGAYGQSCVNARAVALREREVRDGIRLKSGTRDHHAVTADRQSIEVVLPCPICFCRVAYPRIHVLNRDNCIRNDGFGTVHHTPQDIR